MNTDKKLKGSKFYGIWNGEDKCICAYQNIETAKENLKGNKQSIIELTTTRVFIREQELKEVETEI